VNRKQRRAMAKQAKKAENKELAEKIMLFNKMPDECLVCEAPFDKKDKEMVMSWNVVVREKQQIVRIYCPRCWENAQEILKNTFEKVLEETEK